MTIDAYSHCSDIKFRPVEDVLACMASASVDKAVLVQQLGQFDNTYLRSAVQQRPTSLIAVAMINPGDIDARKQLANIAGQSEFRGIRMTSEMLVAAPEFAQEVLERNLHLVLYCPEGTAPILKLLDVLAHGHGSGLIVITHMGTPKVADASLVRGRELAECASLPRISLTLSGSAMACRFPHAPLVEFYREMVSLFGPKRVQWGSNYPVLGDETDYARDLALLLENFWQFDPLSLSDIAGNTASRMWFSRD